MNYMSNIFITDTPTMHPSRCGRCSSSRDDGRKYVDFGVDLELAPVAEVPGVVLHDDRKGVLYLCSLCVREIYIATFPDMGLPVAKIESDLADEKQKNVLLLDRVAQLEKEGRPVADVASTDSSVESSSDSGGNSTVSKLKARTPVSKSTRSKSGVTKSSTEPGHKDVPSLTELLKANR